MTMDRLAPAARPDDRPAGFQRWRDLLFLHWELPAEAVQRTLPDGLTADTFEGRAFVGVVPFTMRDVVPWWSPSVPGVSTFHELNVRTYVHDGVRPGVWFYSLDAASTVAVVAARVGWSLPYYRAAMRLERAGDAIHYTSRRLLGPRPATLDVRYRVGDSLGSAAPGTLEHFLAERYILFSRTSRGLRVGRVHHRPYPLRAATVEAVAQTMVQAAGLPEVTGSPLSHYSPGVDVDVFALRAVV